MRRVRSAAAEGQRGTAKPNRNVDPNRKVDVAKSAQEGEIMTSLTERALKLRDIAQAIPYGVPALLARAAIAGIFWRAASTKLANFDLTIALFQDEYLRNLPFLPAAAMAYIATGIEIAMPALILAGLLTRLATLPLIGMTLFIQLFVYPTSWPDHLVWIALLTVLLARGPGVVSLDALATRLWGSQSSKVPHAA